jgi:hypothetical protein
VLTTGFNSFLGAAGFLGVNTTGLAITLFFGSTFLTIALLTTFLTSTLVLTTGLATGFALTIVLLTTFLAIGLATGLETSFFEATFTTALLFDLLTFLGAT